MVHVIERVSRERHKHKKHSHTANKKHANTTDTTSHHHKSITLDNIPDSLLPHRSLINYVDDRSKLLDEVFSIFSEEEISNMLPDILKGIKLEEVQKLCYEQLKAMEATAIGDIIQSSGDTSGKDIISNEDDVKVIANDQYQTPHDPLKAALHDPPKTLHHPPKAADLCEPSKTPHNPPKPAHIPSKTPHNSPKPAHVPSQTPHDPPKAAHVPPKAPLEPPKAVHEPSKAPHDPSKQAEKNPNHCKGSCDNILESNDVSGDKVLSDKQLSTIICGTDDVMECSGTNEDSIELLPAPMDDDIDRELTQYPSSSQQPHTDTKQVVTEGSTSSVDSIREAAVLTELQMRKRALQSQLKKQQLEKKINEQRTKEELLLRQKALQSLLVANAAKKASKQ